MKFIVYLSKKFVKQIYSKNTYLFYHINNFNLFLLKFFFKKKRIQKIESLIAYRLSVRDAGGANGWLKFLIPKLKN